jgi:hypothetical protein
MQNRRMTCVCRVVFVLVLMLAVAPQLLGLDVMADESWLTGVSADSDDDLFATFFYFAPVLPFQGPVVDSPLDFLTLLSSFPLHPPA